MSPSIVDEIYKVEKKFTVYYLFKDFRLPLHTWEKTIF